VWLLTNANNKDDEGKFKTFNPNTRHATRRRKLEEEEISTKNHKAFHKVFYNVEDMVDILIAYYKKRLGRKENKKSKVENNA